MTVTPDPTQEPNREPEQEPTREPEQPPAPPADDRPTDAITSAISVTAAPGPAPAEPAGPGADGPEVEVETGDAAADHTVAYPSPIPEYAMEPTERTDDPPTVVLPDRAAAAGDRASGEPDSEGTDTAPGMPGASDVPTASYQADTEAMTSLTPEPPPYFPPAEPYLAPGSPPPLAPEPTTYLAPEPAPPAASVRPRSRPLFGTIVWGVILLALAGYVLLGVLVPAGADPTLWLLGGVILIGLLLIVVGIIAALRRAG